MLTESFRSGATQTHQPKFFNVRDYLVYFHCAFERRRLLLKMVAYFSIFIRTWKFGMSSSATVRLAVLLQFNEFYFHFFLVCLCCRGAISSKLFFTLFFHFKYLILSFSLCSSRLKRILSNSSALVFLQLSLSL